MNVSLISNKGKVIRVGQGLPKDMVVESDALPARRTRFNWVGGITNSPEGIPITVTGKSYIIRGLAYPLTDGYGISAILTSSYTITPRLRPSYGKEKSISQYWPVIQELGK
jgi:hypothetical protein